MGLFNRNADTGDTRRTEWLRKKQAKARAALEKHGVSLEGCLIFDDSFDDNGYEYLLVFPDRVEYVAKGRPGVLGRKGRGTEVIPISRITSVVTKRTLVFETVQITASGQVIEFKSNPYMAPLLKAKILELVNAPKSETVAAPSIDPADQLRKLAELHQAGILTEEEFSSKKTELLKKI